MTLLLPPGESSNTKGNLPGYASTAAMEQFLSRIRNRNAPSKVDRNLLLDFGITGGAAGSLLATLRWLGVIDENGNPTEKFKLLQTPLETDLAANFKRLTEEVYAEAFSRLDIASDSRDHIKAYFARNYSVALSEKMTTFLLYMCGKGEISAAAARRQARDGDQAKPSARQVTPRRLQTIPIAVRRVASKEPLSVVYSPKAPVKDLREFWSAYIQAIEAIQVAPHDPKTAKEVAKEKHDLIDAAYDKLIELPAEQKQPG